MSEKQKKILITGSYGLIGSHTCQDFSNYDLLRPTHAELDVCNGDAVFAYMAAHKPDVVIHLAAIRNAALAETQRGDTSASVWQINVEATNTIARASADYGAQLIFTSSNYIFSGVKSHQNPYKEHEQPEEEDELISWYGITKKYAEQAINTYGLNAAIVRISNPALSVDLEKDDYVGKLRWLIKNGKPLFENQVVSMTYGPSLSASITEIIRQNASGTFHVSTTDSMTPFEIGGKMLNIMNENMPIIDSDIEDYLRKNPRRYPQYGALDTRDTQRRLGISFPNIHQVLYNLASEHNKEATKD